MLKSLRHFSSKAANAQIPKRVENLIKDNLKKYPVVVFMKGTPGYPKCGFSQRVIQILKVNIDFNQGFRIRPCQ